MAYLEVCDMADITYCAYKGCPLKECERHTCHAEIGTTISIADFAPTCREYLYWVVRKVEEEGK